MHEELGEEMYEDSMLMLHGVHLHVAGVLLHRELQSVGVARARVWQGGGAWQVRCREALLAVRLHRVRQEVGTCMSGPIVG